MTVRWKHAGRDGGRDRLGPQERSVLCFSCQVSRGRVVTVRVGHCRSVFSEEPLVTFATRALVSVARLERLLCDF